MPDAIATERREIGAAALARPFTVPRILNLGCGQRVHPACVNVDLVPRGAAVVRLDVTQPLPFAAEHFDAVYHSHVLEHLCPSAAPAFLAECRRVLRLGGVLRIAVPDLEQIVRLYLQALEQSLDGNETWQRRYDWLLLELFDQMTRDQSGGAMRMYLANLHSPARRFALTRMGAEAAGIGLCQASTSEPGASAKSWRTRLRKWLSPRLWRERTLRWLLGEEYALLERARFRNSGEVHRTMYDRFSLGRALQQAGFSQVQVVEPGASRIPGWHTLHLERDADGNVLKPDSLFMEGVKEVETA